MAGTDLRKLGRGKPAAKDRFLGPLEAEVMSRVWKRGSATVRDILDDVGRSRDLAYTTVMTIMSRLHEKGLLVRERSGKTYVYRAAFSREEHRSRISRDLVRGLVDEFGDVALAQFVAELDTVDSGRRALLRKLAEKSRGTR